MAAQNGMKIEKQNEFFSTHAMCYARFFPPKSKIEQKSTVQKTHIVHKKEHTYIIRVSSKMLTPYMNGKSIKKKNCTQVQRRKMKRNAQKQTKLSS